MPNFFAMSFEGQLAPSFDLRCLRPGQKLPDGWGVGYYPGGEPSATVLKEAAPPAGSLRSELVRTWEHLESSLFVLHIRHARWGQISSANTQPFSRSYGRRDWLCAHSGSLRARVELPPEARFQPVGSTDTEEVFCHLLNRLMERRWDSLGDADPEELRRWHAEANAYGNLTLALTDGRDLCLYADERGESQVHLWRLFPPYSQVVFGNDNLVVDLTKRGVKSRKGLIASSTPLPAVAPGTVEPAWERLAPGHLLLVREGAVIADVAPKGKKRTVSARRVRPVLSHGEGPAAAPRRYEVVHRTVYRYARPVERSTHILRLIPAEDRLQRLVSSEVSLSVDGLRHDYEDVFGNRVQRALIDAPYSELIIEARSVVDVLDTDPIRLRPIQARTTIPLVWMPWQRQVLQPFLLPPELPESELSELIDYAMSFVNRNDHDLLDTLLDMNRTIFEEYTYQQGATSLATTAFDVYVNRRGVCQDFANLFICMARLLSVPARYVCGYIFTGPKNPNQVQSEASHAWVQVYLPEVGWMGFDPTNGVLTRTDHVRVAVGRSYVDATPTAGTIYVGGGGETLSVEVTVEPIDLPA